MPGSWVRIPPGVPTLPMTPDEAYPSFVKFVEAIVLLAYWSARFRGEEQLFSARTLRRAFVSISYLGC